MKVQWYQDDNDDSYDSRSNNLVGCKMEEEEIH
jgi:hypothetical protein